MLYVMLAIILLESCRHIIHLDRDIDFVVIMMALTLNTSVS